MSVENFDPYFKWLGIAPKDQPPTYYRLLGIDPFTEDSDVISNAADRQMLLIRTFQTGQHGQTSQRLLNEISTARTCLLDSRSKLDYDRALRSHLGGPQTGTVVKEPTVATRPPSPGQPLAVPMSPPTQVTPVKNQAASAVGANMPPVLGESAPAPTFPLAAAEPSPGFQRAQGLPTSPIKRRKKDSSQSLFWIVGIGIGAVLLLVVVMLAGRFLGPTDSAVVEGSSASGGPGTANASTDNSSTDNSSGSTTAAPTVDLPSSKKVDWRSVGKREWTFEGDDIVTKKEMQPGAWLMSRTDFQDIVITLEYVVERGGAGGVYVRVPSSATWPWNQGLEVHFTDDYLSSDVDHESTGSVWHRTPPSEIASKPPGQWNRVRIESRGRDITVTINDKEVTRYRMEDSMPRRGHLGLDGVSGGITYRNVRVEELD